MQAHFSSFTPEAMRAIRNGFAALAERRREFLEGTRRYTSAMLADFEEQRRQRAARDADARRLFMSELRSGVHSLRNRFELARGEVALQRREMAGELRAAREAFREPRRPAGAASRGAARSPGQRPTEPDHTPWGGVTHPGSTSGFEREESAGGAKPGSSKRRHG
jgi:hypothetical protein